MHRKAVLAATALVMLVPTTADAKPKPAKTTVTIEYASPAGSDLVIGGRVKSDKRKCANDRKVKLYADTSGQDEKIGTFRSVQQGNNLYAWQISDPSPWAETYYAKVDPIKGCKGAKSEFFSSGAS